MNRNHQPVCVIGIGNEYRHDDAAGLQVARQVEQMKLAGVEVLEASGEGATLLELWRDKRSVILVDAMCSGDAAGTVRRFDAAAGSLPAEFSRHSTHAFGVADAIEMARALGCLPQHLIVYGVAGRDFTTGSGLSPEVEAAAREVTGHISAELSPT